jgi:hypothetical protein
MQGIAQLFGKTVNINLGKFHLPVPYIEVAAIIFLLFLLVLSLAQFRRHYVDWSLKGAVFGVFFGFLLALILEGFLIIGGKTALTEVLGWKNAPKPISVALESGRTKLINVLGVTDQIPSSDAYEEPSVENAVSVLQNLNPSDMKKVKNLICQP